MQEGAHVIAVARNEEKLKRFQDAYKLQMEILIGDITQSATIKKLTDLTKGNAISGILVNASGPPAKTFVETSMEDWMKHTDNSCGGRLKLPKPFCQYSSNKHTEVSLHREFCSKATLENLWLSTSLRLSVVGL